MGGKELLCLCTEEDLATCEGIPGDSVLHFDNMSNRYGAGCKMVVEGK